MAVSGKFNQIVGSANQPLCSYHKRLQGRKLCLCVALDVKIQKASYFQVQPCGLDTATRRRKVLTSRLGVCLFGNVKACVVTLYVSYLTRILMGSVSKNANSNVSEGDRRSEKRIDEENQNVFSCFKLIHKFSLFSSKVTAPASPGFAQYHLTGGRSHKSNTVTGSRLKFMSKWQWSGCQAASLQASLVVFGRKLQLAEINLAQEDGGDQNRQ